MNEGCVVLPFGFRLDTHAETLAKPDIAIPKLSPSTTYTEKLSYTATESSSDMPWKTGYTLLQLTM